MTDLVKLTIDNKEIEVPKGTSILQACEMVDIQVPRFCYHSRLSIAGNCRMCLVELEGAPKPVASCAFPVAEGQVIRTQSQIAKDARKSVMQFLLANHPLDCPLCDQGGECDLQDFSMKCGSDRSEFSLEKRTVNNPDLGPYIETFMNRCIHCMRCVRFSDEIAGKNEIGGLFRGGEKVITNNENGPVTSNMSGNMIDLCPVGALTSKPAKYKYRSWELKANETVDVLDSILPSIYADTNNNQIVRIRARENEAINQEWISDLSRFSYDGIYNNRIQAPMVAGNQVEWAQAFDEILEDLHETSPNKIAALVGDNLAVEDLYSFKQFLNKTVGTDNIDFKTNGFNLNSFNKANVTFENTIAEIDNVDTILFIGTDLQAQSPVLNSRIFQQTRNRKVNLHSIGQDCEGETLKINNLSKTSNILLEDFNAVKSVFEGSENAAIIVDVETVLTRTDADGILNAINKLKSANVKVNFYSSKAGFINAVDIIGDKTAMNTKQILKAVEKEEIEILFVYGNSNIDADLARKAKNLVYIGTHNNAVSQVADIVLPTVTFTEKNSLFNNVESRVVESKALTLPVGQSRVDWKVFRALSEFVGEKLNFNTLAELREQLAEEKPCYKSENIGLVACKEDYIFDESAENINKKALTEVDQNVKALNDISLNSRYYK